MKKFNALKYLVLIIILVSFSNCTTDNSFEIIEETKEIEILQTKAGGSNALCDAEIIVIFNFLPGTTANEKYIFKNKYYAKRASTYGICSRIVSPICPDKEKWILDSVKYNNFHSSNPKTTGNVNESGTGRRGCPPGGDCSHPDEGCFEDGFIYYDGYGEFDVIPVNDDDSFDIEDDIESNGRGGYY